jgi:DNA-binding transcriptional ArsR family regulator
MARRDPTLPSTDRTLSALSDERRRVVVARLAERVTAVSELCLAVHIAAAGTDGSIADPTMDEVTEVHRDLRHSHLPALTAVSLIDWDRDDETVRRTDHPLYGDPAFDELVATTADDWDDVVETLADPRRCRVLFVLHSATTPLGLDDLAAELWESEHGEPFVPSDDGGGSPTERAGADDSPRDGDGDEDGGGADHTDETFERIRTKLYHVHLPKLDEAGLVDWDRETRTASFRGHPALDPDLLATGVGDGNHRIPVRDAESNGWQSVE